MKNLLEKYKNGTLAVPDEQDAFMHELLQIRAQRIQNQDAATDEIVQKKKSATKFNPFLRIVESKKYFAVAACMLLACFAVWRYSLSTVEFGSNNREEIAILSDNLKPSSSIARGNSTSEKNIDSSIDHSDEKNNVESIISDFEGKKSISDEEKLLLAHAYLSRESPDYSKALGCYSTIETPEYKQDLAMMVARCYFELGDNNLARLKLNSIINDNNQGNEHKEKAAKLLKDLDEKLDK